METVLIIEDDSTMLQGLEDNFKFKGYRVKTAYDGEQGLKTALAEPPDLVILDIMLPKMNGYEICNIIRKNKLYMPIIILTAKGEESDIVLGLNLGADDYVTKPFSIKELLARVEAFLRRRTKEEPVVYNFGNCCLDTVSGVFTRDGKEVKLSPGELKMMHLFLRRTGCAMTCDEIRNSVWGFSHFITLRDIDSTVTNLKNKIEPNPDKPIFIHTIENIGYRFEPPE